MPQGEKDEGTGKSEEVFLLSLPAWLRGIIAPPEGWCVAEIDISAQEVVIAAGLSGDIVLIEDVRGDPYLAFAWRAGLIAKDADPTALEVQRIRNLCKVCLLGTLYGLTPYGLAGQLQCSVSKAADLQRRVASIYSVFWRWVNGVATQAQFRGKIVSPLGWPLQVGATTKRNTLKNFLMQSGGADMLRVLIIAAHEAGFRLCAPLHDSLWVMFPVGELHEQLAVLRTLMSRAMEAVCGLPCRTKVETIASWPNCWGDVRKPSQKGAELWWEIQGLIGAQQQIATRGLG
jgi:DNA polymerase I-like protein with 3'-5' exonuclease and polymerase domains